MLSLSHPLPLLPLAQISESPWLQEYCQGAENEIFLVPWPASMVGLSFYDAAEIAYVETGCIVLGIETVIGEWW